MGILSVPCAAGAEGSEAEAVEEIIAILRERGLIDDEQQERLLSKHRAGRRADRAHRTDVGAALEGWKWSGDLRLRYEGFLYDRDATGSERSNRYRARYRARIGIQRELNDWLEVGLRLASGDSDVRSTNKTLGSSGDFDRDAIAIDRVWARAGLPETAGVESSLLLGKFANPFTWQNGKDFLVFDGDINPEGVAWTGSKPLGERTWLFASLGILVVEERGRDADPKLVGLQLGGTTRVREGVELGLRASGYEWRSLDARFIDAATRSGNLTTAFDGKARIGSVTGFARLNASERWPLLLFATAVRNFTADRGVLSGVAVDEEDVAWGLGVEAGSSDELVKLGLGYYRAEANAVPAQYIDSDVFDGLTNRQGWYLYASKKLWPGTQVQLELFDAEELEDAGGAAGPFVESITDANRTRFRTDFLIRF